MNDMNPFRDHDLSGIRKTAIEQLIQALLINNLHTQLHSLPVLFRVIGCVVGYKIICFRRHRGRQLCTVAFQQVLQFFAALERSQSPCHHKHKPNEVLLVGTCSSPVNDLLLLFFQHGRFLCTGFHHFCGGQDVCLIRQQLRDQLSITLLTSCSVVCINILGCNQFFTQKSLHQSWLLECDRNDLGCIGLQVFGVSLSNIIVKASSVFTEGHSRPYAPLGWHRHQIVSVDQDALG